MRRIKILIAAFLLAPTLARADVLRVCADPNNLPFSNRAGQGFEDKIASLIAHDLGARVEYVYALQNDKFIKHTLGARKCDVMMGVPADMEDVATTQPYYSSTYVFVSRKSDNLRLASLADPRLHKLRIGVHLIGDDSTPPALALGEEGIVDNVHGYMIDADFDKPNPPARLIEAVEHRDVDVAAVWGPLGGYFALHTPVALSVTPMTGTERFKPLAFSYEIAMGVRKDDGTLRGRLNAAIARNEPAILNILRSYGVPLIG